MKNFSKRIVSFLMVLALVSSMISSTSFLGQSVPVYAQDYLYYGTLDIEAEGWRAYNTGLNYNMTGGTAGTIYQGAKLAVIDEKVNSSGRKVAYVYSEDLGKNCYVTSKYIKATGSAPVSVPMGDAYRIVDANYLRIRSNPGTKYSILGTIPRNAKVIVTEYKNGWGKTTYGGTTGWISLVYTKREELRDGIYRIIPKCAPSCVLGLSGNGTEDGTNVEIQERQEGDSQLFAVSKMADGNYLIRNVLSDKMLDVASGSTEAGGNIQIYTENETDAQKWILSAREDNRYIIRSVCSNLALDVSGGLDASGTNIQQWELNYSDAQLFQFEPAGLSNMRETIAEIALNEYTQNYHLNPLSKSNKYTYYSSHEWCSAFISWCAREANIPTEIIPQIVTDEESKNMEGYGYGKGHLYKGYSLLSVPQLVSYYKKEVGSHTVHERVNGVFEYTPQVGDFVVYSWPDVPGLYNHIGLVVAVNIYTNASGTLVKEVKTVEGNTINAKGVGSCLETKVRKYDEKPDWGYISAFISPEY